MLLETDIFSSMKMRIKQVTNHSFLNERRKQSQQTPNQNVDFSLVFIPSPFPPPLPPFHKYQTSGAYPQKKKKTKEKEKKKKEKEKKSIPPGRDIHSFSDPATLQLSPCQSGI